MNQNLVFPCYSLSDIPGFIDNNENKKINKVEYNTKTNHLYKLVRYDKTTICIDEWKTTQVGLLRSVILNDKDIVVGFSPPKSVDTEEFMKSYPDLNENIVVEEFLEGTMINVFWNQNISPEGDWEIATRNSIGAECSFYKSSHSKTFKTMFYEAMEKSNMDISFLNKQYSYSFVLQHPENRIVVPYTVPQLYLVGVYEIFYEYLLEKTVPSIKVFDHSYDLEYIISHFYMYPCQIYFPQRFTQYTSYSEIINDFGSMNTPYNIMGVVLKNRITGERCKIRNPNYELVRLLKGNEPKLQYRYLSLRKEGKVQDYLEYYPEDKNDFSKYRDHVHLFTQHLFKNYISCYVRKEKKLHMYPYEYKNHMFQLHKLYMDVLREEKLIVSMKTVIEYVNQLHPSQLMYSLNYNLRRHNMDILCDA
jgi:hypothetical protein